MSTVTLQDDFKYNAPAGLVAVSQTQDQTRMHDTSARSSDINHNQSILDEQKRSIDDMKAQQAEIADANAPTTADPSRSILANAGEALLVAGISSLGPAAAAAAGAYAIASTVQQAHKTFNDIREGADVKAARHETKSEFTETNPDSSWSPSGTSANDETYTQSPAPAQSRNIMDDQAIMDYDSAHNSMEELALAEGLQIKIDHAEKDLANKQSYLDIAEQNTTNAFNITDTDNAITFQSNFGFTATNDIFAQLEKGGTGTILGDTIAKGPELSQELKHMVSNPSPMGSVA